MENQDIIIRSFVKKNYLLFLSSLVPLIDSKGYKELFSRHGRVEALLIVVYYPIISFITFLYDLDIITILQYCLLEYPCEDMFDLSISRILTLLVCLSLKV